MKSITPEMLKFYAIVGVATIGIQRTEMIIHSILALVNDKLPSDKRFKSLNVHTFLSTNPEDATKRRQTLGVMKERLVEAKFVDINRFEKFVNYRNMFMHNFWREYLNYKVNPNQKLDEAKAFVDELIKESDYWSRIFKGFLAAKVYYMKAETEDDIQKRKSLQEQLGKYKGSFYEHVFEKLMKMSKNP